MAPIRLAGEKYLTDSNGDTVIFPFDFGEAKRAFAQIAVNGPNTLKQDVILDRATSTKGKLVNSFENGTTYDVTLLALDCNGDNPETTVPLSMKLTPARASGDGTVYDGCSVSVYAQPYPQNVRASETDDILVLSLIHI